jgi:hypothetical protein
LNDLKYLIFSHFNRIAACSLHILLLASAPHGLFEFMPRNYIFLVCSLVCIISSYLFFNNHKSYDVFNYEAFYIKNHLGNYKILAESLKNEDSFSYYDKILAAFQKQFPGIKFQWKNIEKPIVKDEDSVISNNLLSKLKNLLVNKLYKKENHENEDYILCLEANIWHNDPILGWYFIFLNPLFVLCSYFSGLSIFVIDFSILIIVS